MLNEDQKQVIYKTLKAKIDKFECPMCKKCNFTIVDSYTFSLLTDDYKNLKIGQGKALPSVPIVCTNCGFIGHHALGVLGLLDNNE